MAERSPSSRKLLLLTDESGRIRAATFVPRSRADAGGPPAIRMVLDDGDLLHEIDLPEEAARQILDIGLDGYYVHGRDADAKLERRDGSDTGR